MAEQLSLFELVDAYDFSKSEGGGKECTMCKEYKPLTSFGFATGARNYRQERCSKCRTKLVYISRKLLKENPYPPKDYRCRICNGNENEVAPRRKNQGMWTADHCHKTDKFRGWLCHSCNIGLGMLKDNTDNLKRAITYIEKT